MLLRGHVERLTWLLEVFTFFFFVMCDFTTTFVLGLRWFEMLYSEL